MHQPQYRDALTGQYVLPWTYLHAIKDYTDMAAHLEGNPAARAVVNFSPILIEQLQDISQRIVAHLRSGAPLPDPVLGLLGPDPVPTDPATRLELLRACLRAQRKQMIERFGPYLELATLAETLATPERVNYASDQLIHDLAVWYHLAWLGETVRRTDALVSELTERGRGFTPSSPAPVAVPHRRPGQQRHPSVSRSVRARPGRALGNPVRSSHRPPAVGFQVRPRRRS